MNDNTGRGPLDGPVAGLFEGAVEGALITEEQVANARSKPPDDLEARMVAATGKPRSAPQHPPETLAEALARVVAEDAARSATVESRKRDTGRPDRGTASPEERRARQEAGKAQVKGWLRAYRAFDPDAVPTGRIVSYAGGLLVAGEVTAWGGASGGGKSTATLAICGGLAQGKEIIGGEVKAPLVTAYISLEDSDAVLGLRAKALALHHKMTRKGIGSRLHLFGAESAAQVLGIDGRVQALMLENGMVRMDEGFAARLVTLIADLELQVVFLDPLAVLGRGLPMTNEAINELARGLKDVANATGAAVALITHVVKPPVNSKQPRSLRDMKFGTELVDTARVGVIMDRVDDKTRQAWAAAGVPMVASENVMFVSREKANHAKRETFYLRIGTQEVVNAQGERYSLPVAEAFIPPTRQQADVTDLALIGPELVYDFIVERVAESKLPATVVAAVGAQGRTVKGVLLALRAKGWVETSHQTRPRGSNKHPVGRLVLTDDGRALIVATPEADPRKGSAYSELLNAAARAAQGADAAEKQSRLATVTPTVTPDGVQG